MLSRAFRILSTTLLLSLSAAAAAQSGQRILANADDGYWYSGRVGAIRNNNVHVAFDDGDRAIVSSSEVRSFDWRAGTAVECNYDNQGEYYAARITAVRGDNVDVIYDEDQERESTTLANCRSE